MSRPTRSPISPEARASLALSMLSGIGSATFAQLIERFGTAAKALDDAAFAGRRREAFARADDALADAARAGLHLLTAASPGLPACLLDLEDVPPVLWARGNLDLLDDVPRVAIVGTRRATAYGTRITRALAGALSRAGACVVSGMARGIDGAAHRAALAADGTTIAVLGTGADLAYPAAHCALHAEIGERGLLLSEHPPGERANGGSFPRRNRIIAGLARLTIVVEAGVKSGALITAAHATRLDRAVAAVPGPIDQPQSEGTNLLIRDGAHVIAGVEDALALMGLTRPVRRPDLTEGGDAWRVWQALAAGPVVVDALCARTGLPADRCLSAVTDLELRGAAECSITGEVRRRIG